VEVTDYRSYLRALEQRRDFFRSMGATATDHGVLEPETVDLDTLEAETLFQHALHGRVPLPRRSVSPPACWWKWRA